MERDIIYELLAKEARYHSSAIVRLEQERKKEYVVRLSFLAVHFYLISDSPSRADLLLRGGIVESALRFWPNDPL